jgi:hypothetical protein
MNQRFCIDRYRALQINNLFFLDCGDTSIILMLYLAAPLSVVEIYQSYKERG